MPPWQAVPCRSRPGLTGVLMTAPPAAGDLHPACWKQGSPCPSSAAQRSHLTRPQHAVGMIQEHPPCAAGLSPGTRTIPRKAPARQPPETPRGQGQHERCSRHGAGAAAERCRSPGAASGHPSTGCTEVGPAPSTSHQHPGLQVTTLQHFPALSVGVDALPGAKATGSSSVGFPEQAGEHGSIPPPPSPGIARSGAAAQTFARGKKGPGAAPRSPARKTSSVPRAVLVARHKRPRVRAGGEPAAAPRPALGLPPPRSAQHLRGHIWILRSGELQTHHPISTPNLAIHVSKAN